MNKNKYSKPFMAIEEFEANSYCAICTVTNNMIWSPVPETNGLGGWQEKNAPVGYRIDTDEYPWAINSKYLGVSSFTKTHIRASDDTYESDDNESYWEIVLNTPGTVYTKKNNKYVETGLVYPAGSVFYKNYNAGTDTDIVYDPKNHS